MLRLTEPRSVHLGNAPFNAGFRRVAPARRRARLKNVQNRDKTGPPVAPNSAMDANTFMSLLEEMVDIKIQQHTEAQMRPTPEIAGVLFQKRETDRRRLEQIRVQLIRALAG